MAQQTAGEHPSNIYQFHALDIDGNDVKMDKYRGRVVLMVNVASECGFTKTNYPQMRELLAKYQGKGFSIAAFPCNQFNSEEPGTNEQIKQFINGKFDFHPDLYAKIDVNGSNAHPLWDFLKHEQHGTLVDMIKWNFTKFLVNKQGEVIKRFSPNTEPKEIEPDIKAALGCC